MPCRICVPHRIVAHIGVAVQVLRVVQVRDDAVGLDEAVERRVVVARVIVRTASDQSDAYPGSSPIESG